MSGQQVNRDLLMHKIAHSGELTALEKLYLEQLVKREGHGYFIESDPVEGFDVWKYSECGELVAGSVDGIRFCPYCGVQMQGGEAS